MMNTVGQTTIKIGNNKPKETEAIKRLRAQKKITSKAYQHALKQDRKNICTDRSSACV